MVADGMSTPVLPPPRTSATPGSVSSTRTRKHGTGASNYVNKNQKSTVLVVGGDLAPEHNMPPPPANRGVRTPADAPHVVRRLERLVEAATPLTFKSKDDYILLRDMATKLETVSRLRENFRRIDQNANGSLQLWELRSGLQMSNFGLSDEKLARLVKSMDRNGDMSVDYDEFIQFFDGLHPLSDGTIDDSKVVEVVDNLDTGAPWEPLVGELRVFNKDREEESARKAGVQSEDYEEGSYEQRHSDRRVYSLLVNKFQQHSSKIRHVFRRFDKDRSGTIDRAEFVAGLGRLNIGVSDKQLGRFYDMINTDGDESISYEEFIEGFEERGAKESGGVFSTITASLNDDVEPHSPQRLIAEDLEVMQVHARQVAASLRDKVYRSGKGARKIFKTFDVSGDGQLSHDEFARSVRTIEPTLADADVDALLRAADTGGNGRICYHEFLKFVEAAERPADLTANPDRKMLGDSPVPLGPGPPPTRMYRGEPGPKGNYGSSPNPFWRPPTHMGQDTRASSSAGREPPSRGRPTTGTSGPVSVASMHSMARTGRFSHTPPPSDTFSLTQPMAGTPGFVQESERFANGRDKSAALGAMQGGDKERTRQARAARETRNAAYVERTKSRSQADQERSERVEHANVARTAEANRRYTERTRMYEMSMETESSWAQGKAPIRGGHKNIFTQTQ